MDKKVFVRLGLAASASLMAYVPAVYAQDAAGGQGSENAQAWSTGDIIVTARRTAEKLERVPISMTVIDDKALTSGTITSMRDVQYATPSLSVSTNNTRNTDNYSLRGIGTTFGSDPAVVAYFAEVPLPGGGGGAGTLFDLANVQVLNGPQGTLFGRNTTGGAVLFEPKRPTNKFEGSVMAGYGNYDNFEQQAIVNIPIIPDVLMVRAAVNHRTRDGFTKDVVTGRDYDNINYFAGRFSVLFTPSDSFENYTIVSYLNRKEHGGSSQLHLINQDFFATAPAFLDYLNAVAAQQEDWGARKVAYNGAQADKQKILMIANKTRVNLTDDITLKNIISYSTFRQDARIDVDGSTVAGIQYYPTGYYGGLQNNGTPAFDQFTEELQLNGKLADGLFDWTVGAYYQRNTPKKNLTSQETSIFGIPTTNFAQGDKLTSKAAYAQATLDFGALSPSLEGLKFTGGIRRTHDKREDYAERYLPDEPGQPCEYLPDVNPNCRYDFPAQSFKATTYTLGLNYQVTDTTMLYATVRRGFKSGGINLQAVPSDTYSTFGPETVDDIEIGAKTRTTLGTMPVSASVAVFRDKFKDIQRALLFPAGSSFALYLVNASSATIKGFEGQIDISPTPELTFGAKYSYLDSSYGNFVDPLSGADYTGLPLPYTPKHKVTLTAGYNRDLGDAGEVGLQATYAYQSSYRNLDAFDPDIVVKGYGLLSLSAGWKNIMSSDFDLDVYATNVTNKLYRIGGGNYFYSLGFTTSIYGEPRMVGARLTYHFGS